MIRTGNRTVTKLIALEQIAMLPGSDAPELYAEKPELLDNLVAIYNYGTGRMCRDREQVVADCIGNGIHGEKSEYQIETIYNIMLFDDSLTNQSLARLMESLLDNKRQVNNSFYEEYVIKITAQIIRRLHASADRLLFLPLIEKVRVSLYGKNISHSVLSYSRVYLALARYYIGCGGEQNIEQAKRYFICYKDLSANFSQEDKNMGNILDEKEFYKIL